MDVPTELPRRWSDDGLHFEQRLPATAAAVTASRAAARAVCRAWRLGEVCDALVLAVSELVTNVVRAGGRSVTVRLQLSRRQVRLEVQDDLPGVPTIRRPDADAEGGRGLWLVSTMAARFGVDRTETGKAVWAEFVR